VTRLRVLSARRHDLPVRPQALGGSGETDRESAADVFASAGAVHRWSCRARPTTMTHRRSRSA